MNWIGFWVYTETKYELLKKLSIQFTAALLYIKNKSVKHAFKINKKCLNFIPTSKMTDSKSDLQIWLTSYSLPCFSQIIIFQVGAKLVIGQTIDNFHTCDNEISREVLFKTSAAPSYWYKVNNFS